jgi:phage-related minor tail protein
MGVTTDAVSIEVKALTANFLETDGPASQFAADLRDQAKASKEAAAALRDHRLAILALTNSFLGILDSANQVTEAQDKLNELQKQGKRGTQEYKEAVLAAITAQSGLEEAVLTYGKELADAGGTQEQVIAKIRNLAGNFEGLDKRTLASLIAQVRDYVNELGAIPSFVQTTMDISRQGATNVHARQHGGPVSMGSPYIVGERGPELFVPSTSGHVVANGGGGGGDFVFQIDGQEFFRIARDGLHRLGRRNVTAGIP